MWIGNMNKYYKQIANQYRKKAITLKQIGKIVLLLHFEK